MKKTLKIIILFAAIICLVAVNCGCSEEPPVYFYGVVSFKSVGSENGVFAYVPVDGCGDVRIYENYTTLPEGLKDGDVIKMKFESAPEIRQASVDNKYFLAFWPVPQEITIVSENVSTERTGSDYLMTIPSSKVENITENSKKIKVLDGDGKVLYTFENVAVGGEKVALTMPAKDGHKALALLEYRLVAEKG